MRHLFLKYLTSALLVAAFLFFSFGLTEAGAGGFGLFQTRDSATMERTERDTSKNNQPKRRTSAPMFDDIIEGKAVDSVVFDASNKMIYSYKSGDVTYQGMNLKADYMRVNMQTKDIFAHGYPDTVDGRPTTTHPEFTDGGSPYSMDTITYNLDSRKAKIKGIATQEGDGWLIGSSVKMHPDESIHIGHGMYI